MSENKLTEADIKHIDVEVCDVFAERDNTFYIAWIEKLLRHITALDDELRRDRAWFDNFDIVDFVEQIQSREKESACVFAATVLIPAKPMTHQEIQQAIKEARGCNATPR